jgi:hypothetical protein
LRLANREPQPEAARFLRGERARFTLETEIRHRRRAVMPDEKKVAPKQPDPADHPDPDGTKGSLEDDADSKALRLQVPFRGFKGNQQAFEIASPGPNVDSLPGESGEHGQHSGEDT